jgi:hypothetical protein
VSALSDELLAQAQLLATKEPKRPKQASLRRSISSAYYALFHLLIEEATRRFVRGTDRTALRHCLARAFGHADMKSVAESFAKNNVSGKIKPGLNGEQIQPELRSFAETFVDMQQERHEADYNPARHFNRTDVLDLLERTRQAMNSWPDVRNTPQADTFLLGLLAQKQMRM